MTDSCQHTNPLKHQGTSQHDRFLEALDPENVELHGLDVEDWLYFARDYAQLINYYPPEDAGVPDGDWLDFFMAKDEVKALLKRYGDGDIEPHLALFISFLKLLDYSQQSLNQLPKRHLDFYYKEVLKLKKKPFSPDRVHVLFELAQNAKQELVEEDVLLNAGEDSDGNSLQYSTTNSLVVNSAKVASLKSVFVDEEGILRQASVTNSADGQGADFEEDKTWMAFGDSQWPEAELSFFIASHLLQLKEGKRTIKLDFQFKDPPAIDLAQLDIEARFTGEKDWLKPVNVHIDENDHSKWSVELSSEKEPIVGYKEEVHKASLETGKPVMKVSFKDKNGYEKLKLIEIETLKVTVQVDDIKSLDLQNALGSIDPAQPFMPFGTSPKVGSKLSIVYPELDDKPVSHFEIGMRWMNLPANFNKHYSLYEDAIRRQNQEQKTTITRAYAYSSFAYYNYLWLNMGLLNNGGSDTMRDDFKVDVISNYQTEPELFKLFTDRPQIEIDVATPNKAANNEIEVILNSSFYHDLYQEVYLNAVLNPKKTGTDPNTVKTVDLPKEPYTPLLEELTLNYTASENISFVDLTANEPSSAMYHQHPFGAIRVTDTNNTLLPKYNDGHLFIGLKDMEPAGNISLLFQVAEGTENPLHSSFEEGEGLVWEVLSDNNWISLKDNIVRNETNNFLRSGIAEIAIPDEANTDNSLLGSGNHWLRIHLKDKPPDAVSRFIGVHAQGDQAIFNNQGNTTDHLKNGLPADTINKLVHPRAALKSVAQPYASFGGKPAETDDAFYRRVSERLRHKKRAVSIWDYEHMVLQQFPSLYKVKCLNHTYWNITTKSLNELAPGNVILVLIPQISEQSSAEFRLKPQVSQNFKDEVEAFIGRQNSMHANVKAANPNYEAVQFNFNIRFKKELDFNFYRKQTQEDLKRLLAPWAYETGAEITFGGRFTEYEVVNYLENLDYVDYITDFKMYHPANETPKTVVEPTSPMAILVPAGEHDIEEAEKKCA